MEINALMMDEADNVVTCVSEVRSGDMVTYRKGTEFCTIRAEEDIPYCHKIALEEIPRGGKIIKYGEILGETSEQIKKGHWVSHKNLFSIPRDYDSEMVEC